MPDLTGKKCLICREPIQAIGLEEGSGFRTYWCRCIEGSSDDVPFWLEGNIVDYIVKLESLLEESITHIETFYKYIKTQKDRDALAWDMPLAMKSPINAFIRDTRVLLEEGE